MTRLGLVASSPAACCLTRQRHSRAMPPSMQASLEPVVEQPVAWLPPGAFHRLDKILTQRRSSSAVCGYSSLSIMFLAAHSAINCSASGSIHVVTNVARLSRAFPSRMSSSLTTCNAVRGRTPCSGNRYRGISPLNSRKYSGLTSSSAPWTDSSTWTCSAMTVLPGRILPGRRQDPSRRGRRRRAGCRSNGWSRQRSRRTRSR